jgi:hypothetical protein
MGHTNYNTLTTVISVTNTRSIQKTPMFHDCTKTHLNITINKWKCAKLWAMNTFEVTGPHQVFVYMLLTFKLLKLFNFPQHWFPNMNKNWNKYDENIPISSERKQMSLSVPLTFFLQWRQIMCPVIFHVWHVSWRKILY